MALKKKQSYFEWNLVRDHKVSCQSWGNISRRWGSEGQKRQITTQWSQPALSVYVCECQFKCGKKRSGRLWSESEWAISPAALRLFFSLSQKGSWSRGRRWKWARSCGECGDLVANPALFVPLSPLNDFYCILPRDRRRRRSRRRRPKVRQKPSNPLSLFSSASLDDLRSRKKVYK